jgi:hypothetical protein
MTTTTSAEKRSLTSPDEVLTMPKCTVQLVTIGEHPFARAVMEPGWRWSESMKPIAGTESCQFPHACYVLSGAMHIAMDDGTEIDIRAGDVFVCEPGHDAWVVGDEPCVLYDLGTADDADFGRAPS